MGQWSTMRVFVGRFFHWVEAVEILRPKSRTIVKKREFLCPKITQLSDRYVGTVDKLYISNELVLDLQSAMVNINDAILDLGVLLEGGLNFP